VILGFLEVTGSDQNKLNPPVRRVSALAGKPVGLGFHFFVAPLQTTCEFRSTEVSHGSCCTRLAGNVAGKNMAARNLDDNFFGAASFVLPSCPLWLD
jgi:hypothetical protein